MIRQVLGQRAQVTEHNSMLLGVPLLIVFIFSFGFVMMQPAQQPNTSNQANSKEASSVSKRSTLHAAASTPNQTLSATSDTSTSTPASNTTVSPQAQSQTPPTTGSTNSSASSSTSSSTSPVQATTPSVKLNDQDTKSKDGLKLDLSGIPLSQQIKNFLGF